VLLKIKVFRDVMLWYWASGSQHFEGSQCLHLQGHAVQAELLFFWGCLSMKMKVLPSFETLEKNCLTQHYNQEQMKLYTLY
jgi:hypothetical protein